MASKQLEVQIMGQSYLLACPDGGQARLLDAVEKVDTAMCRIRDAGKVKARDRIAVLAALNLAFDVAERPAATAAPLSPPAPPAFQASGFASSEFGASTSAADSNGDSLPDARLTALTQRLDAALGGDGRLL